MIKSRPQWNVGSLARIWNKGAYAFFTIKTCQWYTGSLLTLGHFNQIKLIELKLKTQLNVSILNQSVWFSGEFTSIDQLLIVQTLVDRKEQDVKPGLSRENFSRTDCQLLLCSNSTAWSGNRHDDRTQEPMLVPGAILREMYLCYRGWRLPSGIRLQTIHLQLCPGCDLVADRSQWSSVTSRAIHL